MRIEVLRFNTSSNRNSILRKAYINRRINEGAIYIRLQGRGYLVFNTRSSRIRNVRARI